MTSIALLREIEAFLCFNQEPNKDNCMALKKSIQEHLAEIDGKPKSDFEVMAEMATRDLDIRVSNNFVEAKQKGENGYMTMGVDKRTIKDFYLNDNMCAVLYVFNIEQFITIKKS